MKVLVLINGGRMNVSQKQITGMRKVFEEEGATAEIVVTRSLEHAREMAQGATRTEYDALYAAGGDGTLHLILNELTEASPPLGIIPMGTVNALAKTLGISSNAPKAIRQLLHGKEALCDCGRLNQEKSFLCFASAGYDAGVVHAVQGLTKRWFGRVAYGWHGLTSWYMLKQLPPLSFTMYNAVELDTDGAEHEVEKGKVVTGHTIILSNITNYAGFQLFPDTRLDNGNLEAWLFTDCSRSNVLGWIWNYLRNGKARATRGVRHFLIQDVEIQSPVTYFLQLDGDAVPLKKAAASRIKCQTKCVRLILPG